MTDHVDVTPPAFLHELVQAVRIHDHDLLLVEVREDWRFAEAERWAAHLVSEIKEVHGLTVTAVVLPPGAHIGHYRPVEGDA